LGARKFLMGERRHAWGGEFGTVPIGGALQLQPIEGRWPVDIHETGPRKKIPNQGRSGDIGDNEGKGVKSEKKKRGERFQEGSKIQIWLEGLRKNQPA